MILLEMIGAVVLLALVALGLVTYLNQKIKIPPNKKDNKRIPK